MIASPWWINLLGLLLVTVVVLELLAIVALLFALPVVAVRLVCEIVRDRRRLAAQRRGPNT